MWLLGGFLLVQVKIRPVLLVHASPSLTFKYSYAWLYKQSHIQDELSNQIRQSLWLANEHLCLWSALRLTSNTDHSVIPAFVFPFTASLSETYCIILSYQTLVFIFDSSVRTKAVFITISLHAAEVSSHSLLAAFEVFTSMSTVAPMKQVHIVALLEEQV